jgi:hypothetical protein
MEHLIATNLESFRKSLAGQAWRQTFISLISTTNISRLPGPVVLSEMSHIARNRLKKHIIYRKNRSGKNIST